MIPVGLLFRALWFAILLITYYESGDLLLIASIERQTPLSIIIGSLPGYWCVSDYLLICLFWAYLSHSYSPTARRISKIRAIYILINVLIYGTWIVLMGLITYCSCTIEAHRAEVIFAIFLNVIMAITFALLGPETYRRMKTYLAWQSSIKMKLLLQKVGFLSVICGIAFIVRAVMFTLLYYLWQDEVSAFAANCVYLMASECLPEMVILVVIGKRSGRKLEPNTETSSERSHLISPN